MDLDEIISLLDQNKNTHGIMPKKKFNTLFEILPAGDDGNCLFYSIEQLNSRYNYSELRLALCEYYKDFDVYGDYPENSVKQKLQIQMISDNEEENGTLHQDNICNDQEWGGIMDVIAITDILKINIFVMIMRKEGYTVQSYIYRPTAKTIFIKYNGRDHFEPLLPKFDVKSPTSSGKSHTATAKSVSSETRRMIEDIDKGRGKKSTRSTKHKKRRVKNHTRKRK